MQANWNGLFLVEPRWRVGVIFAVGGVLLQAGLTLLESPMWASALNLGYAVALLAVLQTTGRIMHPPSPILNSDAHPTLLRRAVRVHAARGVADGPLAAPPR
jgi:hypothetical protein